MFKLTEIPARYRADIETAVDFLKKEGGESVYLFGSLAAGKIKDASDIDLGVKGLPPEKFFSVCGKLYLTLSNEIDVIDFDKEKDFYALLESLKEVVKIG
ncbi:putative nucleotidyltransferases [Candidatus Termititenax aidoneus]|uniref:Nucleotidyltransferases n=1 Tax=Termititenax aidoneus TaxID=2218524 RepID=A0A388TA09_TERA1|nr:putative nucleotidyltransferases [Candidatus Termititenax aidoneus]